MKEDKYIDELFREHQDGFNKKPRTEAWDKLEEQLTESTVDIPKRNNRRWYLTVAASVLIIVGFFLANNKMSKQMSTEQVVHDVGNTIKKEQAKSVPEEDARIVELKKEEKSPKRKVNKAREKNTIVGRDNLESEIALQLEELGKNETGNSNFGLDQSRSQSAEEVIVTNTAGNIGTESASTEESYANFDNEEVAVLELEVIDESEPNDVMTDGVSNDFRNAEINQGNKDDRQELEEMDADYAYTPSGLATNKVSVAEAKRGHQEAAAKDKEQYNDFANAEAFSVLSGNWMTADESIILEEVQISSGYNGEGSNDNDANKPQWNINMNNNLATLTFDNDPSIAANRVQLELTRITDKLFSGSTKIKRKNYVFTFQLDSRNNLHVLVEVNDKSVNNYLFQRE